MLWKKNYTLSSAPNDYTAKFAPRYIPCIVNKVLSNVSYNLKDTCGKDLGNYHISDLKKDFLDSDDEEDIESAQEEE